MLRIKTFLDRSAIHGIVLFADQAIKKKTIVWEFNQAIDIVYSPEEWDSLRASISSQSFKNLLRLSYKEEGLIYLCVDNAQFMNHSGNCCNIVHLGTSKNRMYATRDIARGEELLCNYFSYSDTDDYNARNLMNNIILREVQTVLSARLINQVKNICT